MTDTQTPARDAQYWHSRISQVQKLLETQSEPLEKEISNLTFTKLAQSFDHTLLKPEATPAQVQTLCGEALKYKFATVCVREPFAAQAAGILKDSGVQVCCVVGFHDPAASSLEDKLAEARRAMVAGASELDMVINWLLLKQKNYVQVFEELRSMRQTCRQSEISLKLILETSQLSSEDIIAACVVASEADFDFVKTSTGFLGHGAKVEDVKLMRQVCVAEGRNMQVKASGGIRTIHDTRSMLQAGASRIGASASVGIMHEFSGSATEN